MTNQTENYLLLKPLSERINRICAEMSDSELKSLVKEALKEQIVSVVHETYGYIQDNVEDTIERNKEAICTMEVNYGNKICMRHMWFRK